MADRPMSGGKKTESPTGAQGGKIAGHSGKLGKAVVRNNHPLSKGGRI